MNNVLVPVDGSSFAEHALPYAIGIARRTGATLHLALVHVPAEPVGPTYPLAEAVRADQEAWREREAKYLEGLVERLEGSGVEIRPALLHGRVSTALVAYGEERGIDLVVMTTHGRGGLQRTWLGSTADSLIRHSQIPLLVVRPSDATRELGREEEVEIHRVVAALDGSETAEVSLHEALELGITGRAALTLVHVVQPGMAGLSPYLPETFRPEDPEVGTRADHMRAYLARIAESTEVADWRCQTTVELSPRPARAVLEVARSVDADLIVMGTRGRGGLRRMVLGSVADEVIRNTDRPVLVHRGRGPTDD